ncbi:hypothetical protein PCNPT3_07830 [Psychromonas sp. CNPT3]|uniref:hypothetical protein n=1 Tax=Psychromonas sp. CNPT3 TaxID=314282 RepID=UPI00006E5695|nr:hypothetical protein [Psychromonas sp. CNPT3]AGH81504.1 hypothetical protein PCNPT3_07830 [Psychromonas sp. CNPT3]
MLRVDHLGKSYYHFLDSMQQMAKHKSRFLIAFNGASPSQLLAAKEELSKFATIETLQSAVIAEKASETEVDTLFKSVTTAHNILLLEQADVMFVPQAALKNAHHRESIFNLNHLFKHIAKHKGIVVLATSDAQTLTSVMSSKVDVLVRFS